MRQEQVQRRGKGVGEFLAFQEYNAAVLHELHTVGISGRPGGLGIYINVQVRHESSGSFFSMCSEQQSFLTATTLSGALPPEGDPSSAVLSRAGSFLSECSDWNTPLLEA